MGGSTSRERNMKDGRNQPKGGVLDDKMGGAVIERSGNFGLQETQGNDGWKGE